MNVALTPGLNPRYHARPMAQSRSDLEQELSTLSVAARERRSVDGFTRAGLEGFAWAVLGGVVGKLLWDSARPPLFLWPLIILDLALLWDALRAFLQARRDLARELRLEARVRELRVQLGIDPAPKKLEETGS